MSRRTHRYVRNVTVAVDLLLINVAFVLAYYARYVWQWLREVEPQNFVPYRAYLGQQLLLTILLIITFSQLRVWTRRRGEFWLDEVSRISYATAMGFALTMAYTFFFQPLAVSRLMLFWAGGIIIILISLARLIRRFILYSAYQRGMAVDNVLVVGSEEAGRSVMRTLLARTDLGFHAVGYLGDQSAENHIGSGRIPYLGSWRALKAVLKQHPELHTVFIAFPFENHQRITALVNICQEHGVRAQVVPDLFQLGLNHVELTNMGGLPMLGVRDVRINQLGRIGKRLLDLTILALLTVPALLLATLIAVAVKLDSDGPVLYVQERVGEGGKPFKMIKFRSMVVDADARKKDLLALNEMDGPIFKIKDDPRLTRIGRIIRRLSLDELPQFVNILLGHMSFVGPRPPLPEEVAQYQDWHLRRLEVKGGLTGLWQVSGRSDLTFDEQCLLDIYYIENWSLSLDLRIILQTLPFALFGRGAY